MTNRIVAENAIVEGRTERSYWDVPHSRDIEGFATQISVNAGGTVDFKINVNAETFGGAGTDYKIEIFRLGHYGGAGAREVAELVNNDATVQVAPQIDRSRGLVDAGNWEVTDTWEIPADAVSGVYLARLQRLDGNGNPIEGAVNQIPFIVRNDGVPADIVLQTSDTTWQAYNGWGGNNGQLGANFYGDAGGVADPVQGLTDPGPFAQDRAYAVSYNRPFITRNIEGEQGGPAAGAQDYLFGADYAAIFWLEQNGYDVTYISGVDTDRMGTSWFEDANGNKIRDAFISVGHDEYWSGQQRGAVEAARADGVHLLFWSGNEVYWKTRWDVSIVDGVEYRTLVCYKETWANGDPNAGPEDYANIDPSNEWTGTWRDARFNTNPLAGANDGVVTDPLSGLLPYCNCAETQLTGQLFGPDGTGEFGAALDVPAPFAALRVWRDTSVAQGGALDIAPGILGYEWNTSPQDEFRPAGLIRLSDTTAPWSGILIDQGNRTAPGEATHNLSLYRDESGALVFGAGTVFWTWGLSDQHDNSPYGANIENTALQQFTVNMFADMGIQPGVTDAILESRGLVRAIGITDTVAARTTLNDIAPTVSRLSTVLITGTATDDDNNAATTDDGRVAVVEISFDGGETWRVAQGTTNWSYAWRPQVEETVTVQVRAIDDSLNISGIAPTADTVEVTAPIPPATFSLFDLREPTNAAVSGDGTAAIPIELGITFTTDRPGEVTQLRYYRAASDSIDTDVRTGRLWGPDGAVLATVTFTSDPGEEGWQVATLSAPVVITAGATYTVSYRTENNYLATTSFFSPSNEVAFDGVDDDAFTDPFGVISAPQSSVANGTGLNGNGVFKYGQAIVLPNETFNASNYWVDVTFDPTDGPNDTPVIISNGGGDLATITVAENTTAVTNVDATDASSLLYTLAGGDDAGRFTINSQTGLLSFRNAPNFEAPADANGDNVYVVNVRASDGALSDLQTVSVTVTDVLETSQPASRLFSQDDVPASFETDSPYELGVKFAASVAGTITALQYFRGAVDADDTDVRTLNLWEADGDLLASVTVTSGVGESGWQVGTLSTGVAIEADTIYIASYGTTENYAFTANYFTTARTGPDGVLSAPASGSPSNLSTGGVGNGLFQQNGIGAFPTSSFNAANYWVDVLFEEQRPANTAPTFTSLGTFIAPENQLVVGALTASDAEANPLSFALLPGGDAGLFTVDATTGALRFLDPQNAEASDTSFTLTVSVSDGVAPAVQQVLTVTIGDVDEFDVTVPTDTDASPNLVTENTAIGSLVGITASAFDSDATTNAVTYSLVDTAEGLFAIDAATGEVRVAAGLDAETATSHAITIRATSADGSFKDVGFTIGVSDIDEFDVTAPSDVNVAANEVAENAPIGSVVGITARATDADATTSAVTYRLIGSSGGRFAIDPTTGVVTLAGTLDFENAASLAITVRATSADSSVSDAEFLVQVSNVNEPAIGSVTLVNALDNGTTATLSSSASIVDPDVSESPLTPTFGWQSSTDGTTWSTIASGSSSVSVAPLLLTQYRAIATYTDPFGINVIVSGSRAVVGSSNANAVDGTATGVTFILGRGGSDTIQGYNGTATIDGGAGTDTVNLTAASPSLIVSTDTQLRDVEQITAARAATIDLLTQTEAFTVTGSGAADTISMGSGADQVNAGAGNDTVLGGGGDDVIRSGTGNDVVNGGAGTDTASYFDQTAAVVVDLALAAGQNTQGGGTDTLAGFENLTGGSGNDTLRGDAGNNLIQGVVGNDLLEGRDGNDDLRGGDGNDTLRGGLGNDRLDGGVGTDIASYFDLTVGVRVDLAVNVQQNTLGGGLDTIVNAENGSGGSANDVLFGNSSTNGLTGNGGDDLLNGRAGTDTLTGGAGNDRFEFSLASHTAVGAGRDTIVDFTPGDLIVLETIDANTLNGAVDDDFTSIGASFNGTVGRLRYSGGILAGDTNGDGIANFEIRIQNNAALTLASFDL